MLKLIQKLSLDPHSVHGASTYFNDYYSVLSVLRQNPQCKRSWEIEHTDDVSIFEENYCALRSKFTNSHRIYLKQWNSHWYSHISRCLSGYLLIQELFNWWLISVILLFFNQIPTISFLFFIPNHYFPSNIFIYHCSGRASDMNSGFSLDISHVKSIHSPPVAIDTRLLSDPYSSVICIYLCTMSKYVRRHVM